MSTEFGAKSLRFLKLGAALALASGASGCATTVVALGASAAAVAVSDKTAGAALDDTATTAEIKAKMLNGKGYSLGGVQVAVYEGFVLLAGSTPTPQDRIEAERRAWTSAGTKNVANEIVVGPGRSVAGVMQDGAISAEIKAKYFRSSVKGVNYKVETSQKTVFLLGIARSRMELTDAVEEARTVGGVQKVVSYVRILDRPVIQQPETAAEAAARRAQEQGLAGGPKPAETLPYAAGEQMAPAQDYSPYETPSYMKNATASDPYAPPRNYSAQSYAPPPAPYQAPQMASPSLPPRYAQPDFNTPKFAKPSSASAQYPRDPQFDSMPDGSPVSGRTLGPASDTFAGEVRPPVPDAAPAAYSAAPPSSYAAPSTYAATPTYSAPSSAYAAAPASPPPVTYTAPPAPGAGPVQLTPP